MLIIMLLNVFQLISCVQVFAIPWTEASKASLYPSLSPRVCTNSCPLSWRYHPTISCSVAHFSSCLQSFPASESFPVSQLFASGGQSNEASALALVLPMNIQDWFPLGLTSLISLLSKGLSRVSLVPFCFLPLVVSSAYLRMSKFLLVILIPACASSILAFHMMYSAYKLNKQGDNIQPWHTPFPILN